MTDSICARSLGDLVGNASPFARVLALGYQDGPTFGAVACGTGPAAYRFAMLAVDTDGLYDREAWDRGAELRVFGLAPLRHGDFERIAAIIGASQEPRWPVWVPTFREPGDALPGIAPLLDAAGPPRMLIAAADLLGPFAAARVIAAADAGAAHDWFAFLGLNSRESVGQPR